MRKVMNANTSLSDVHDIYAAVDLSHRKAAALTFFACWRFAPPGSVLKYLDRNLASVIAKLTFNNLSKNYTQWSILQFINKEDLLPAMKKEVRTKGAAFSKNPNMFAT